MEQSGGAKGPYTYKDFRSHLVTGTFNGSALALSWGLFYGPAT